MNAPAATRATTHVQVLPPLAAWVSAVAPFMSAAEIVVVRDLHVQSQSGRLAARQAMKLRWIVDRAAERCGAECSA